MRTWESLGEMAARPATVAIRALELAREGLTQGLGRSSGNLQLFISHAKLDGLSLAGSLNHAITAISGLKKFYDAVDIESVRQLEEGIAKRGGVVGHDRGPDRPIRRSGVVCPGSRLGPAPLSARPSLSSSVIRTFHPPSGLGLEGCPWVRIPDGSLTRILYFVLRENLRLLLIQRGVHALGPEIADASIVLPRRLTWDSLHEP